MSENNGGPGYPQLLTFNQSFGYDSLNRLTSASDSGGWSRNFGYDAYGNMWVTANTGVALAGNTPTWNVYSANNQLNGQLYDAAGNALLVNGNTAIYDAENRTLSVSFDVRMVTDQYANLIARHDYLPFGEEIPGNTAGRDSTFGPSDDISQRFTGKERDSETSLDYFGARYYGSSLGRFTSADDGSDQNAANPQSWNLYSYVRNNPLANIDPTGNDCVTTSDQTDRSVSVTVTTGTCGSGGGTYVAGTVDTSSLTYNGTSVGYSYNPYDSNATFGSGTLNLGPAPSSDISPFGLAVIQSVGRQTNSMYGLMGAFAGGSVLGGGAVAGGLALGGGGAAITTLGLRGAALLPIVPSAVDKLQKIGLSLQQATELVESPTAQKLVDNANGGNINVLQNIGDKVVRITLDPTGSRIISAGYIQSRNVANGIASGRFTPMK